MCRQWHHKKSEQTLLTHNINLVLVKPTSSNGAICVQPILFDTIKVAEVKKIPFASQIFYVLPQLFSPSGNTLLKVVNRQTVLCFFHYSIDSKSCSRILKTP